MALPVNTLSGSGPATDCSTPIRFQRAAPADTELDLTAWLFDLPTPIRRASMFTRVVTPRILYVSLFALTLSQHLPAQPRYTVHDLGQVYGLSNPGPRINRLGQVTGT